ncbi:MAG: Gfo/Idh/MocA family oxidoreductase [Pirellulaceae bacterium]|nr:Gfo/Idh/MocA family oxidoreductase [Planctomycetales bacterium]
MTKRRCRWGIMGTAGIARKNWQAIADSGNGKLVAVASRTQAKAQQFIDECQGQVPHPQVPEAVEGYQALLDRTDIDAVYIPLPTGMRCEWVVKAAAASKHVLAEKPAANNAAEVKQMIDACDEHGVQYMDGVMYMHTERLKRMRDVIDDGHSIGKIKRISAAFSFCAPDEFVAQNIRANSQLEPLGCLGDLGWYTVRFALWVMNWQMPKRVCGQLLDEVQGPGSPESVPTEFSGELFFEGGVSASFYNAFTAENQQWAHISGSRGLLTVNDFVLPYLGNTLRFEVSNAVFDQRGCVFTMEDYTTQHATREYSNNAPSAQEANLFRNFAANVLSGKVDAHWPKITLQTQQILDACLASARNGGGVVQLAST